MAHIIGRSGRPGDQPGDPMRCPVCNGTGLNTEPDTAAADCPTCQGTGRVTEDEWADLLMKSMIAGEHLGPPEPTIVEYPDLDAETLRTYLAAHRSIWDMPTLFERRPDVVNWIAARWRIEFDMVSNVVLIDKATGAAEHKMTADVREVVAEVLEREIAQAQR